MKGARRVREHVTNWVADHPASAAGRLAAMRFGWPSRHMSTPIVTASATAEHSVLMAPANYAGQAAEWTKALRTNVDSMDAKNYAVDGGGFGFDADALIPRAVYHNSVSWQREQLAAASRFTHFMIESFQPPFGRYMHRDLYRQIRAVEPAKVALMCHGTDVRLPSLHAQRTPWSPLRSSSSTTARQEILAARNLEFVAANSSLPVFVSTPDLLEDVDRAVWCPVVIDVELWTTRVRSDQTRVPVVVHAPSKPGVKGTEHIDPILRHLDREGVIRYRPVRDVPHASMPSILRRADIVVDQIGLGSYGVVACEAMASGCAVVSHVTDAVRALVERNTGIPLPILEADPATLDQVVRHLAEDATLRVRLSERGRAFAEAVHDGRESARRLLRHWVRPD